MTICAGGKHHDTNVTYPCDFRVVEKAELPHGCSIALTYHYGHFHLEAVAHRQQNGKPWYPTLDEEFFLLDDRETEARESFSKMKAKWQCATAEDVQLEIF